MNEIQELIKSAQLSKQQGNYELAREQANSALLLIEKQISNSSSSEVRQTLTRLYSKVTAFNASMKKTQVNTHSPQIEEEKAKSDIEPIAKPNITFDDVIGHKKAKKDIRDNLISPIENPRLNQKYGIETYRGLMFFGPPGTGKTTLAKAVAHHIDAEFYNIKCSSILDKYVGSSEKKLEAIFEKAKESERAIVFFDEIDAITSSSENSTPVIDRLIALLKGLAEGIDESYNNVFVLASTNYPWKIESGIRRRLHPVYLGLPNKDEIISIIKLKVKNMPLDRDIDYKAIAKLLEGYSGSDISKIVNKAAIRARDREDYEERNNPEFDVNTYDGKITQEDFMKGIAATARSLSEEDIRKYQEYIAEYKSNL